MQFRNNAGGGNNHFPLILFVRVVKALVEDKEIIDLCKKETYEQVKDEILPSLNEVKVKAQELLDEARRLDNNFNSLLSSMNSINTEDELKVLKFSKDMVKSEKDYKMIMTKVFDFQNILNKYLGQEVLMTFVYISPSSGKVELYGFEADMSHITLDKTSEERGGQFSGRYRGGLIKNNSRRIINSDYNEKGKQTLDSTFKEVWQRFRISKSKLKMGGGAHIYWKKENGKWDGRYITGAGPLGEAYLAFFVNEYIFTNMMEPAVEDYILNKDYGVVQVDNASGFLKGDVTKGKLQFGAKINGAQAMGYVDIIKYAAGLVKSLNPDEYLKNLKEKLDKGTPNAVYNLKENIDKTVENEILNEIQKRIDSNYL